MPSFDNHSTIIEAGARPSPLSQAQVKEVLDALKFYHPLLEFKIHLIATIGDRDLSTSLRTLDRTDFFTRDIDHWVLEKPGRIGIHSAKDLPHPLTAGLTLFCLTRGLDPTDSLILREGSALDQLPSGALIATSSLRREESVRQLRPDFKFCDIRGTIEQRLAQLNSGKIEGVVVAEAALIRLGLARLNRIKLPGFTVEGQGQLAIVGRLDEMRLKDLFACLHDQTES